MKLFTPIWKTDKIEKQEKALYKVMFIPQKKLLRVVREAPLAVVREKALSRIYDQDILFTIALDDPHPEIREKAFKKLNWKKQQEVQRKNPLPSGWRTRFLTADNVNNREKANESSPTPREVSHTPPVSSSSSSAPGPAAPAPKTEPQEDVKTMLLNFYYFPNDSLLPYKKEWKLLLEQTDRDLFRTLAKEARSGMVRYYSCKQIGGHLFPQAGSKYACRCKRCEFEYHKSASRKDGEPWTCDRCHGVLETKPFTEGYPETTITYPDGTVETVTGYDGLTWHTQEYCKKYGLF